MSSLNIHAQRICTGVYVCIMLFVLIGCPFVDPLPGPSGPSNEAPIIEAQRFTASENIDSLSIIGTVVARDPDNTTLVYSIVNQGGGDNHFVIGESSGEIRLAPDYRLNGSSVYTLRVQVSDGEETAEADITIEVERTSENTLPVINAQSFSILEGRDPASRVGVLVADDPNGNAIVYRIVANSLSNERAVFVINADTGELRTSEILDYETADVHTIRVEIQAGDESAEAVITIYVQNVNEQPTIEPQEFTINENIGALVSIGMVLADDPDLNNMLFSITKNSPETGRGLFTIDRFSGVLRLNSGQGLDYETGQVHEITVEVSDGELSDSANIRIVVNDVDENVAPMIDSQVFTTQENGAAGSEIDRVVASDPNGDLLMFRIVQNSRSDGTDSADATGLFSIDEQTGALSLAHGQGLDHEGAQLHKLTVEVSDGTSVALAVIRIRVENVNEPPVIENAAERFMPFEDIDSLATIGTVQVSDPEGDAISYNIATNSSGLFDIDSEGNLRLASGAALDYDDASARTHSITVRATAGGQSTEADYSIEVQNVNELPEIETRTLNARENIAGGALVGTVGANDPEGDTISYRIVTPPGLFTIDSSTGEVSLAAGHSLDYESNAMHRILVEVTAGGQGTSAEITIQVQNVNEPPVILEQSFTAFENIPDTDIIGIVIASDPEGRMLEYSIEDPTATPFEISTNGMLSLRTGQNVDFEMPPNEHSIVVRVSDGTQSATASITISEMNVNEAPSITARTIEVLENTATVGTIHGSDPDADDTPNTLRYRITRNSRANGENSVDSIGIFSIHEESGVLSITSGQSLDYETAVMHTITIELSDNEGLTATAVFTIVVRDVNENVAPTIDPQTFSIHENSIAGSVIDTVAARDLNNDVLSFRITENSRANGTKSGSATGIFTLNEGSGDLSFVADLDYEIAAVHTITVEVADEDGARAQARITIQVQNVNEPPVIENASERFMPFEDIDTSATIGTVQAGDPEGDAISYSIVSNSSGLFAIDSEGNLSLADGAVLDYDDASARTHSIIVRATAGGQSTEADYSIEVQNVNEPPQIETRTLNANENIAGGSLVGTVGASDPEGDTISYRIVTNSPPGSGLFSIDSDSGAVSLAAGQSLDYESSAMHRILVEVTAGGHSTSAEITIQVQNVNEPPVILEQRFTAFENIPDTDIIGTVIARDPENPGDPEGRMLEYSIEDPTATPFEISTNGMLSLRTGQSVDFEIPPNEHSIAVRVSDGTQSATATITIQVQNVNEAPSITARTIEVLENTAVIGTIHGSDPDADDTPNTLRYRITRNSRASGENSVDSTGIFSIHEESGVLGLASGQSLDYETAVMHTITIELRDNEGLTATAEFTIVVRDVNENVAPTIDPQTFSIHENSIAGSVIDTVAARDLNNDALSFRITENSRANGTKSGSATGIFTLNEGSGALSFVADLDYETAMVHTITVEVVDEDGARAQATITIEVQNVNEPPVIENASERFMPLEDINSLAPIGRVQASDPEGDAISYSIVSNSSGLFAIDGSGNISLADSASLDYDDPSVRSHNITIRATAGGHSTEANYSIEVQNVNEPPQIEIRTLNANENIAGGTLVGTVQASDPEGDTISYRIVGSLSAMFSIDSTTGDVSLAAGQSLDYESIAMHTILVEVSAGGHSTSADITIQVQNVNEPPVILEQSFNAFENIPDTDIIGTVIARDPENPGDPEGRMLEYSIEDPTSTPFEISTNGMLSLKTGQSVDFEMPPNEHSINVQVSDGTQSATATITIRVQNVNEPPVIDNASDRFMPFEDIDSSDTIGRVQASDPEGDAIIYSIVSNSLGLFDIDGSGNISLADGESLDYEDASARLHNITIRATAAGQSTEADYSIEVQNVDEAPQIEIRTLNVNENIAGGTLIGTVGASDPEGEAISYRIVSSLSALFSIDSSTGELSLAAGQSLDYESESMYQVPVGVSDGEKNALAFITVEVQNIDEAPVIAEQSFTAFENIPDTDIIGTVTARDPEGMTLSYSIENLTSTPFEITPNGMLSLKTGQGLDFEMPPNEHSIAVQVSDGAETATATITIQVQNVNESPSFAEDSYTFIHPENIAAGSLIGTLSVSDPEGDPISFRITSDSSGIFTIDDAGNLSLATDERLNFATAVHTLTVEARDGVTSPVTVNVTIMVEDFDYPPSVSLTPENTLFTANENISDSEVIGRIVATDSDTTTLSYSISTVGNTLFEFADSNSGEISLTEGSSLDYENKTTHSLTIEVSDGNTEVTASITIQVQNINEPPVIDNASERFMAFESIDSLATIGTVQASDPEDDAISYSITTDSSGLFDIDGSGNISLADGAVLDYDDPSARSHNITIRATAGGQSTEADYSIEVQNVNELPIIETRTLNANEDTAEGTLVGTVVARDPEGEAISYRIVTNSPPGSGLFTIDSDSGALSLASGQSLDYESESRHTILVEVTAGEQSTSAEITIEVQNIDEAPVILDQNFTAFENIPDTDIIGTVIARDPENPSDLEGRNLQYSIENPTSTPFEITPDGMLSLKTGQNLDFEMPPNEHSIVVQVSDGNTEATASITIRVENVNEPPVIENASERFMPIEIINSLVTIGTVVARDPEGEAISYSITTDSSGLFAIDSEGNISLIDGESLDYDDPSVRSHNITVRATAGGQSTEADYFIEVQNVNELPIIETRTLNANEDTAEGALVGTVVARDPDGEAISYRIVGSLSAMFSIDSDSGALSLASGQSLDYESAVMHTILVEVTDGEQSTSAEITIQVQNVNEPPSFAEDSYTFMRAENIASGSLIGTVSTSDPENDALTLSITTDSSGLFIVDGEGKINLADGASLDYETLTSHSITVQARDGEFSASVHVTIEVENVFDSVVGTISALSTATEATGIILDGSRIATDVPDLVIDIYEWSLASPSSAVNGVVIQSPHSASTEVIFPYLDNTAKTESFEFELTVTSGSLSGTIKHTVEVTSNMDIDSDGDGLIEIRSLTMLHNMRHNLSGTGYKTSSGAGTGDTSGCPESGCNGYELIRNLNFDRDNDMRTQEGVVSNPTRLIIDSGDIQSPYFLDFLGWVPIGTASNPFNAAFNGNGHSIHYLTVSRQSSYAGLFGYTSTSANISNIHLVNATVFGNSNVGALVGESNGTVSSSSSSGRVLGNFSIGGLIGVSNGSTIANFSAANVEGTQHIGGLIGQANNSVTASYATGAVDGNIYVGSLIGELEAGQPLAQIRVSYATGNVLADFIAGVLIGDGRIDRISGGFGFGEFTDSGGDTGFTDSAPNSHYNTLPEGVTSPSELMESYSDPYHSSIPWNGNGGAWDFTRRATIAGDGPSLRYEDYDGAMGDRYYCDDQPAPSTTAIRIANCGSHLPGQFTEP